MKDKLSRNEIRKYYWNLFLSLLYLSLSLGAVYLMVDLDSFYQYINLPSKIEHNRYIFIILVCPLLFVFGFFETAYGIATRKRVPEKYAHQAGKYLLYFLCIATLGVTPIFSIASGYYLEYHGYERCFDNKRGALSSIGSIDYAKSTEYCPRLIEKIKPNKDIRG